MAEILPETEGGKKRIKSGEEEEEEGEDRISSLPDLLVHHILSFLPATDLPKTSLLSKWWNLQWIHVPVLKFIRIDGMPPHKFFKFIDKTLILHDFSNIHKFKIKINHSGASYYDYPDLSLWFRFAVRKDVKELNFDINGHNGHLPLPEFVFSNSSLVKLKLSGFRFFTFGEVNWGSVKSLRLDNCLVDGGAIENALSGTPLLQYLELRHCGMLEEELVIASKSLKTLILAEVGFICSSIEISCPNLERLRVSGLVDFRSLKLTNLPSSVHATLDFYFEIEDMEEEEMSHLVQQTLRMVEHVEKLEVGHWLVEWRSRLKRSTKEGIEAPK